MQRSELGLVDGRDRVLNGRLIAALESLYAPGIPRRGAVLADEPRAALDAAIERCDPFGLGEVKIAKLDLHVSLRGQRDARKGGGQGKRGDRSCIQSAHLSSPGFLVILARGVESLRSA